MYSVIISRPSQTLTNRTNTNRTNRALRVIVLQILIQYFIIQSKWKNSPKLSLHAHVMEVSIVFSTIQALQSIFSEICKHTQQFYTFLSEKQPKEKVKNILIIYTYIHRYIHGYIHTCVHRLCLVGKGSNNPPPPHPFSKILPFLEIQNVPSFYRPIEKTKVLNESFNQLLYKFYPQSILISEEYLLR